MFAGILSRNDARGVLILHAVLGLFLCGPVAASDDPPGEVREIPGVELRNMETFLRSTPRPQRLPRPDLLERFGEPGEIREHPYDPPPPQPHGWDPYRGGWGMAEAAHLVNRTVVGGRFEEIEQVYGLGLEASLDLLLTPTAPPTEPGSWVHDPFPDIAGWTEQQIQDLIDLYILRGEELRMWWPGVIVEAPLSLTETMVHFWHDHFATGMETVFLPQSMYQQNALFREQAMGNFRTLVEAIAVDPAMLIWLNGNVNVVGDPNENFSRELLELFTLGEGSGYTQNDVAEAARACTGWVTDGVAPYFLPFRFDNGEKTILGHTGNWDLEDLIGFIFEEDAAARYLCTKLYRWFLDDQPAPQDVAELAQTLRANNYEVEPVLRQILGSARFLDPRYRGAVVRDGLDLYVGQLRRFHVTGFTPTVDPLNAQADYAYTQMYFYGHILLDPPNVAGWPGHRSWINTFTLPIRKFLSGLLLEGDYFGEPLGMQIDVMTETARLSNPENAHAVVDDLALLCFGQPPTQLVRQAMIDELLQGELPIYWSMGLPDAEVRLRDLYRLTMQLPDYQLK